MRIAINIDGFLLNDKSWNEMVETLFQHIAVQQPTHEFVFISNKTALENEAKLENVSHVLLEYPSNNSLGFKLWYDYKLPSIIKKQKIDVFVNTAAVCSFRCNIPQILLIKHLTHDSRFIEKRLQKSLEKANKIVAFGMQSKTQSAENYPITEKILTSSLFIAPELKPMDWQQKEAIKEKHSEGKEFFLYSITKETGIDFFALLKAFSLFKKRQQSNMQLLLVGETQSLTSNFLEKMASYKYRDEVKILAGFTANETIDLTASAYCLLHFSNAGIDLSILKAMQIGIPVIVLQKDMLAEIQNNHVLRAETNNPESIAEQMKIIYKDENLRSRLVAAGRDFSGHNTVEKTANEIWPAVFKAVEQ